MAKAQEATKTETNGEIVRKFDERKFEKPVGSLKTIVLKDFQNNPNRPDEVFKWNDDKIEGLIESYLTTGFQSTYEATIDKWGGCFIAGGGHHRTEALRRAIDRGLGDRIKGLFRNDDGEWCIKLVVKKYTKEEMLTAFMIENADAWGKDNQQNQAMMAIQVKSYLDGILASSKTVEDFIANVNSPYPLKMDKRSFTRTKNAGAGASLMVQYLGENTWSRAAIDMLLKVLYDNGEVSEQYRELAEKLPNVTLAYRFKQLMTEVDDEGDKIKAAKEDQDKALKLMETHQLSRQDIEAANKIKEEKGLSPLEALDFTIEQKKDAVAEAKGTKKEPAQKVEMKFPESAIEGLKRAVTSTGAMVRNEESWSKAQAKQAESLLKQLAENMKTLIKG